MTEDWWLVSAAIVPSIVLAVLFVIVVRAMVSSDRREREAEARGDEAGHTHVSRIPTTIERRDNSGNSANSDKSANSNNSDKSARADNADNSENSGISDKS